MKEEIDLSALLDLTLGLPRTMVNPCPEPDQLSTALTLCDPSWNYDTHQRKEEEYLDPAPLRFALPNPEHEKMSGTNDINKELKKKKRNQALPDTVSLQPQDEGPWKIRKKLTVSDIGNCSRLLMPKKSVIDHVMCYLDDKFAERVMSGEGIGVMVVDCDTNTGHYLNFKLWGSAEFYILNGDWRQEFVHRRGLKEKDRIGLYWDTSKSMFMFSVLERAIQSQFPA
ncbi:PREDICTED: putative B3 domain-containing protein At1g78640 [Prunus mume]|uniref:B3 domain-containing protein At1g78640 n=1 Tax=Prunus mume TaxID=102107 RepID=A0ABM0PFP5_PRUMU|nr:PREDICTED: putative B3 domain-containing protein At1g78640 [Prunus mume]